MSLGLRDVILQTAGGSLSGWTSIDITQSLEQASNTFSFSSSDQRQMALFDHAAKLDAACKVLLGTIPVINGYIEKISPDYSATNHEISVSGRDITCDIIDSSAILPNQEMRNVTLAEVARILCAPHGITVDCPDPGKPFDVYAINDGETVFASLEQHARQRQMLLYTQGDGVLHIGKAKPEALDLVLKDGDVAGNGVSILSGRAEHDSTQQFGQYTVKSQAERGKTQIRQDVKGNHPRSNRILIVRPEKPNGDEASNDRGQWEAKVRKARGRRATITLQGWECSPGKLWRPRLMPVLRSPRLGFNMPMMVTSTRLHVDDSGGTNTTLELVDPDIYE